MPKPKEKEKNIKKEISTVAGLFSVAVLVLLLKTHFGELKYAYKTWVDQKSTAAAVSYQGDKEFKSADYINGVGHLILGGFCRLTNVDWCDIELSQHNAEIQKAFQVKDKDVNFIEKTWQVGIDTVTALVAQHPEEWKSWGVLKDGTLLTVTKLGAGRKAEMLTSEELWQKLQAGQTPAFIYRVEENNTRDGAEIDVAKTPHYVGNQFAWVTTGAQFLVMGADLKDNVVLHRGGEMSADQYLFGTRLYWNMDMNAPSLSAGNPNDNLNSFTSQEAEMNCPKVATYEECWIYAVGSDAQGNVYEIRTTDAILESNTTWKIFTQYLKSRDIQTLAFADPMFEQSQFSSVDDVISRDVLIKTGYPSVATSTPTGTPLYFDQDNKFSTQTDGIIDGLYIVEWQDGKSAPVPVLIDEKATSFTNPNAAELP